MSILKTHWRYWMRYRRVLVVSAMVGSLVLGSAGAALAQEDVAPGPGIGKHVSEMAPEHPRSHGAMFGACVTVMARGLVCDHANHNG